MAAFPNIPDSSGHLLKNATNNGSSAIFGHNGFGVSLITDSSMLTRLHNIVDGDMPPEQAKYINFVTLYDVPEASEAEGPVEEARPVEEAPAPSVVDGTTVEYAIIYSPMAYASFYNSDDDELEEPEPVGESVEGEAK